MKKGFSLPEILLAVLITLIITVTAINGIDGINKYNISKANYNTATVMKITLLSELTTFGEILKICSDGTDNCFADSNDGGGTDDNESNGGNQKDEEACTPNNYSDTNVNCDDGCIIQDGNSTDYDFKTVIESLPNLQKQSLLDQIFKEDGNYNLTGEYWYKICPAGAIGKADSSSLINPSFLIKINGSEKVSFNSNP